MSYIEREALIEHIKDLPTWWADGGGVYGQPMKYPEGMFNCDDVIASIENASAADVVEVVHGEWINDFGSYSTMHCSKCEWRVPYIEDYWAIQELYSSLHNCPNCGAKMDAERKCDNDKH